MLLLSVSNFTFPRSTSGFSRCRSNGGHFSQVCTGGNALFSAQVVHHAQLLKVENTEGAAEADPESVMLVGKCITAPQAKHLDVLDLPYEALCVIWCHIILGTP